MDNDLNPLLERADRIREHRRQRAHLPFPEKIRILVRLQERRAPILRMRGIVQRVWKIEEGH